MDGLTNAMMEMARDAESKHGDEWAILLEPNVGQSASPIYGYADGEMWQTPYRQETSDAAEDTALDGMCGLVVISSYWDDDEQEFVASASEIENDA
ncbi:MAG TPA: hypothetical protein VF297_05100 [Pyrinomonadaceae bacterium]